MHRCPAEGAGFSSSFLLAMVSSRLLLEPVGHLLPEESGWLPCSYAVGPQASVCHVRLPLAIREVWESGGVKQHVSRGGQAQVTPLCIA